MQVRFVMNHQTSLDGIKPVTFEAGEVVDLPAEQAARHIASGAAVEHKAIAAAPEDKAIPAAPENKKRKGK